VGKQVTAARLEEICHELIAAGAHNINLVTPGHYAEQLAPLLKKWRLPVPVVWNTNGYEKVSTLGQLAGAVQIYLPDLKYADDRIAEKYSHAPDYFATAAAGIDEMYRQVGDFAYDDDGMLKRGVLIRHLILPGCVENSLRVIEYVSRRFAPGQVLFALMRQYIPCGAVSETVYPELNRTVSDEEYALVQDALFASGIEDGFVQDGEAASENFIPQFDTSGV
jgi:putative pyruvate formate lyase activating enzyme